ncbi:MAG: hypothetical protein ACRDHY_14995 [Anaerolineales bacterium]
MRRSCSCPKSPWLCNRYTRQGQRSRQTTANDPDVHDPGQEGHARPFLASPELRLSAAVLVAGAALCLAVLFAIARWTDLLMLDLRRWRPSTTVRGLEGAALAAHFEHSQTTVAEERPFRLTMRLPATARVGDVLAAERWVARRSGRHCFFVLAYSTAVPPPDEGARLATRAQVWVGDRLGASFPVLPKKPSRLVRLDQVRPSRGRVRVRFELVAEPAAPGAVVTPSAVHFAIGRLRRCGP